MSGGEIMACGRDVVESARSRPSDLSIGEAALFLGMTTFDLVLLGRRGLAPVSRLKHGRRVYPLAGLHDWVALRRAGLVPRAQGFEVDY